VVPRVTSPPALERAFWICSFTASKLKLAPFCIGGNSTNVSPTFATPEAPDELSIIIPGHGDP
jgi:hypothetical protein